MQTNNNNLQTIDNDLERPMGAGHSINHLPVDAAQTAFNQRLTGVLPSPDVSAPDPFNVPDQHRNAESLHQAEPMSQNPGTSLQEQLQRQFGPSMVRTLDAKLPEMHMPTGTDTASPNSESVAKGALIAGIGTGAALALPAVAGNAGFNLASAALGWGMSMPFAAASAVVPLLTGYLGSRLFSKHRAVGAMACVAAGGAAMSAATAFLPGTLSAITPFIPAVLTPFASSVLAAGSLAASAAGMIIPGAIGGGLFALGKLQGKLRGKKDAGIVRTMGRGVKGLVTVPRDILRGKKIYRYTS